MSAALAQSSDFLDDRLGRDADARFGYEPQEFGDHEGDGGWTTRRVKRRQASDKSLVGHSGRGCTADAKRAFGPLVWRMCCNAFTHAAWLPEGVWQPLPRRSFAMPLAVVSENVARGRGSGTSAMSSHARPRGSSPLDAKYGLENGAPASSQPPWSSQPAGEPAAV
jgi:hypothetical protein